MPVSMKTERVEKAAKENRTQVGMVGRWAEIAPDLCESKCRNFTKSDPEDSETNQAPLERMQGRDGL